MAIFKPILSTLLFEGEIDVILGCLFEILIKLFYLYNNFIYVNNFIH